ncbi:unnamed protein product [Arabidopsis lyrata]|uniref:Predicted protein n=1 Tax=Arabidopsis lyrata subsp. lyrata TaxID=81972 RepID=D7MJD0_ARALL|nr:predicted protein [Arabidopsis lyrata subsp. lyrata]CAH8277602.1 unnamed protein product [Arabidopsis lyrata]
MTNEVWAQFTNRHPGLSMPLLELFIDVMTSKLQSSSNDYSTQNSNCFVPQMNLAPPHWRESRGKFVDNLYHLIENIFSTKKEDGNYVYIGDCITWDFMRKDEITANNVSNGNINYIRSQYKDVESYNLALGAADVAWRRGSGYISLTINFKVNNLKSSHKFQLQKTSLFLFTKEPFEEFQKDFLKYKGFDILEVFLNFIFCHQSCGMSKMRRMCCIGNNATENIIWTPDLDVTFYTMYLQECKINNPINKTQFIQTFAEQTGHELSWKTFKRRLFYLTSLYTSIRKSCTPDPRTGMPTMTNEAWAQITKRHPELLNPSSKPLVDLFIQRLTSRIQSNSIDVAPVSSDFDPYMMGLMMLYM